MHGDIHVTYIYIYIYTHTRRHIYIDIYIHTHIYIYKYRFVWFSFSFSSYVSIPVVHPYSSTDTATAWKKFPYILSERSDFYMFDNLSIAVHTFVIYMLTSFSVDEILLLEYYELVY